jgi:twinkle protein
MVSAPKSDHLEYPFPGMNDMLLGARRGEVIVFTAGTGAGKTEVVTQIVHHWIKRHNEKVGCLYLESRVSDIGWKMTGLELGKRLLIDRDAASQEEAKAAFDRLKNNLVMYDHFGSTDPDNLFNKIRYMVRGLGCGTIVLDHISIVVSGIEDGDERRLIDNMMTRIASLVQELNCRLIVISHLKRPDGTPFEEGGQITLAHLRGSASIAQLGYDIVALERNQQDEKEKHLTHIRILKCRWTGRTGSAGYLSYDEGTGLLTAVSPDFQDDTAEPNTDFE